MIYRAFFAINLAYTVMALTLPTPIVAVVVLFSSPGAFPFLYYVVATRFLPILHRFRRIAYYDEMQQLALRILQYYHWRFPSDARQFLDTVNGSINVTRAVAKAITNMGVQIKGQILYTIKHLVHERVCDCSVAASTSSSTALAVANPAISSPGATCDQDGCNSPACLRSGRMMKRHYEDIISNLSSQFANKSEQFNDLEDWAKYYESETERLLNELQKTKDHLAAAITEQTEDRKRIHLLEAAGPNLAEALYQKKIELEIAQSQRDGALFNLAQAQSDLSAAEAKAQQDLESARADHANAIAKYEGILKLVEEKAKKSVEAGHEAWTKKLQEYKEMCRVAVTKEIKRLDAVGGDAQMWKSRFEEMENLYGEEIQIRRNTQRRCGVLVTALTEQRELYAASTTTEGIPAAEMIEKMNILVKEKEGWEVRLADLETEKKKLAKVNKRLVREIETREEVRQGLLAKINELEGSVQDSASRVAAMTSQKVESDRERDLANMGKELALSERSLLAEALNNERAAAHSQRAAANAAVERIRDQTATAVAVWFRRQELEHQLAVRTPLPPASDDELGVSIPGLFLSANPKSMTPISAIPILATPTSVTSVSLGPVSVVEPTSVNSGLVEGLSGESPPSSDSSTPERGRSASSPRQVWEEELLAFRTQQHLRHGWAKLRGRGKFW